MCCAKSDEFPVTVLHGFYVDSSLKKCFCKFIAEGYLMNVGFARYNYNDKVIIGVCSCFLEEESSKSTF